MKIVVGNRSAEHGGVVIADTASREWPKLHGSGARPVAVKVLADAEIAVIESGSMEGIEWYVGKSLIVGDVVLADISKIELASGVVQVIYG